MNFLIFGEFWGGQDTRRKECTMCTGLPIILQKFGVLRSAHLMLKIAHSLPPRTKLSSAFLGLHVLLPPISGKKARLQRIYALPMIYISAD